MKSKEEVIKIAYDGEKYDWDENGWLTYGVDENSEFGYEPFGEYETRNHIDGIYEWRPLSLKGIDTNNDWISINSENDLPTEDLDVHIVFKKDGGNFQTFGVWDKRLNSFWSGAMKIDNPTHYQQIINPNPPLHK